MVNGIGNGSALAREAIRAAMRSQSGLADQVRLDAAEVAGSPGSRTEPATSDFASKLLDGVDSVNEKITKAEQLPSDFASGKIENFHEIAVQLKEADFGFRFALEIRNKLIDAYREVMRMSV